MRKLAPGLVIFLVVVFGLAGYAFADSTSDWAAYKGAWFSIKHPQTFQVKSSMKSRTAAKGYDSAFFVSPGGEVEFYVFSPQWNGEPRDIGLNPITEEYAAQKEEQNKGKNIRRVTIQAKDKSYLRSFVDTEDTNLNTRLVFGIKYRDQKVYDKYREVYLNFVRSLRQYSD